MAIQTLKIFGSALLKPTAFKDNRGFFMPHIGLDALEQLGLDFQFVQMNVTEHPFAHTPWASHAASACHGNKDHTRLKWGVVGCDFGLETRSPSYMQWLGLELRASDRQILVIPPGCAHGFLTLEPNTEMMYLVDKTYSPDHELVIRWDDPALSIEWPYVPQVMSDKDRFAPDFHWSSI